jgi:bacterioferritin-associated ferredoxin
LYFNECDVNIQLFAINTIGWKEDHLGLNSDTCHSSCCGWCRRRLQQLLEAIPERIIGDAIDTLSVLAVPLPECCRISLR